MKNKRSNSDQMNNTGGNSSTTHKGGPVRRFFRQLDIYARPVNMTYRGKDKFYSLFGGIVSSILLLLIVGVFFYKVNDVV